MLLATTGTVMMIQQVGQILRVFPICFLQDRSYSSTRRQTMSISGDRYSLSTRYESDLVFSRVTVRHTARCNTYGGEIFNRKF